VNRDETRRMLEHAKTEAEEARLRSDHFDRVGLLSESVSDLCDVVSQLVQDHRFPDEPDPDNRVCCVCKDCPGTYENYKGQWFCTPCSDGDPCVKAADRVVESESATPDGGVAQPEPGALANSVSYMNLPQGSGFAVTGEGWVQVTVRRPGQPDAVFKNRLQLAHGETATPPDLSSVDAQAAAELIRILKSSQLGVVPINLVERLQRWSRGWHLVERNAIAVQAAKVQDQLADALAEQQRLADHNEILQDDRDKYRQCIDQLIDGAWVLCDRERRRTRSYSCQAMAAVRVPNDDGHYHRKFDLDAAPTRPTGRCLGLDHSAAAQVLESYRPRQPSGEAAPGYPGGQ
jgi:hypothetical protein